VGILTEKKVSRRNYVKYGGAGIVVVAGAAAGAYYYSQPKPTATTTAETTVEATSAAKKSLVVGMTLRSVLSMDPAKALDETMKSICSMCYDRLLRMEPPDYKITPCLAESYDVSADGLTYTFHLRKGVKFHTGNEVKADAVKFTIDRMRIMHPEYTASWMFGDAPIKEVKVVDDYTAQIILETPFVPILSLLGNAACAGIIDPAVMEHENAGDAGSMWLDDHSFGAGPFMMKEWVRDVRLVIVRNPNYWGVKPWLEEVRILSVPESVDQRMMLSRGDIDMAYEVTFEDLKELRKDPNVKVVEFPCQEGFFLYILLKRFGEDVGSPFVNPKVRWALLYAIDWQGIIDTLCPGYMRWAGLPQGVLGALSEKEVAELMPYDPERAKQLLREAGYKEGDGPTWTHIYWPGAIYGVRIEDLTLKLMTDWEAVGFHPIMQLVPPPVFEERFFGGDWITVTREGGILDYADPDNAASFWFHSGVGASKRQGYDVSKLDPLTEAARVELDPDKRAEIYKELVRKFYTDPDNPPCFVGMYQAKMTVAMRKNVQGFFMEMYNFDDYRNVTIS
jgi:peptide/nickel transport system substrate-binding protein